MLPIDVSRRSFLQKTSLALSGAAPLMAGLVNAESAEAAGPLVAYVGTFSSPLRDVLPTQVDLPPGNGRGIHRFEVNRTTGELTPAGIHEMTTSPSCLLLNAAETCLYCTNETDQVGGDKQGTVSALAVDRADGALKLLGTARSGGAGPTYGEYPSVRAILAGGQLFRRLRRGAADSCRWQSWPLATDHQDRRRPDQPHLRAATNAPPGSFSASGHDRTHAHQIEADPSGRFALHVDLGLDKIYVWKFDAEKGLLAPAETPSVSLPPGDGPRHFRFHPNGRWLYSIQEEGSTVVLFDFDAAIGRLAARQTISTLPPGFAGSNFCSEIMLSADGRFVYAGNRLHDSIAIFSIGPDGTLGYIGDEWTHGNYPRSFNFDPTGQFLYCCNQRGDNVTVFRADRKTGGLNFTGHYAAVGNPSTIVFVDLART